MNKHIRLTSYIKLAAFISFAGLFVLSVFAVSPIVSKADSASAATGTATPSTTELTISGLGHTSSINVTPINNGGAFISGGEINFSLSTNNYTGYVVQLMDMFNNGRLINTEDESLYIEPIDDYYTAETFPTNKWGIKPSKYVDVANSSDSNVVVVDNTGEDAVFIPFYVAPIDAENNIYGYAAVVDYNSIADSQNYSVSLGAKVDKTIPSGTYESTYSLLAMANPAPYSISFDKNTEDVVFSLPVTRHSESNTATTMNIPNMVPQREHYSFLGWCNVQPTNTNGTDSCTGTNPTTGATATIYNPNGDGTNLTYGLDHTVSNTNVTLYAMWQIDTFTCTKQYRLQNADGTWGNYIADGTETINYGGSCAYAKTVTDYKNAANGANNAQASTTATNVIDDVTVSLDFYRNTYTLIVSAGSNTSAPTGSGTYRWGDTATIGVTKATNVTCTTYNTPTWAATAGSDPGVGENSSFTIPKSDATVTASSVSTDVAQRIELLASGAAASVVLNGVTKTSGETMDLTCGTYSLSGIIPEHYNFNYWSSSNGTIADDTSLTTTYTVAGPASVMLHAYIDAFDQTVRVRYEKADGTFTGYTIVESVIKDYGETYSWSTARISNFDSATYQAASVPSYTVTTTKTNDVTIYRKTFTCTKQYRLQNADGTWGNYVADGSVTAVYGGSCAYAKTVADYKNAANGTNNAQASTTATNVTANQTLSLDFYRNTFTLTVTASTNTSAATGGGTYRWGQTATVGVTKASNVTCTTYGTPTWTQSGTAGTFSATSGTSVTFTMGKGNATVTATSAATNVAQTVTLSRGTGVASIKIGSTNYIATSVSLNCGTYNISGNYSNESYVFSSWARTNGVAVANTAAASTTMTVSGAGTLTLNTSRLPSIQSITASTCTTTAKQVYDTRDNSVYTIQKLADGKCWLLDNLRLDLTNATVKTNLTSSTTNASDTTLSYLKNGGGTTSDKYATAGVSSSWSTNSYSAPLINTTSKDVVESGYGKYGAYYNYCAATAGSYCYGDGENYGVSSGDATEDICPKGWRMPTGGDSGEYMTLYMSYGAYSDFRTAFHAPLSGSFDGGSASLQNTMGLFWSSSKSSGNGSISMDHLRIQSSRVDNSTGGRLYGESVRCVLQ